MDDKTIARFWSKVDKRGPDDCWPWRGALTVKGYARFPGRRRTNRASRIAWELAHEEPVPRDKLICHTCDNRACVNPKHLYVGTALDNNRDRSRRGRWRGGSPPGERSGQARLTAEQILEMRALHVLGHSYKSLGRKYGYSANSVRAIVLRRVWRHV